MENDKDQRGNISNVHGDIIGGYISGSGHNIGKYVVGTGTININNEQLLKIPKEYADSIKSFTDAINQQFKVNNVPQEQIQEVQRNIYEYTKGLEGIKLGQDIGVIKKTDLKAKFVNVTKSALSILPKTLQVITAFTPLAPFSSLIGENTQLLVQSIQKEV